MRRLLILLLLCAPLWAQNANFRHLKTVADDFPEFVHSSVLVLDANEKPVTGLDAKNFRVSLGETKIDWDFMVQTFKQSKQGLSVLLLVDVSGSMAGKPLEKMRTALNAYVDRKNDNDEIAIVTFAETPLEEIGFTKDKGKLQAQIKEIKKPGGSTALYYAINYGLDKLAKASNPGRFMILFSDGWNDTKLPASEGYNQEDVIGKALNMQVPIFTVGYAEQSKQFLPALSKMSEKTGGSYFETPNEDKVQESIDKVDEQIQGAYILSFPVYGMAGDGKEHQLSVTLMRDDKPGESFTRMVKVPPNREPLPPPDKEKKKTALPLWAILTAAGVLLALGIVLFFVLRARKKKRELEQQQIWAEDEARRLQLEQEAQYYAQMQEQTAFGETQQNTEADWNQQTYPDAPQVQEPYPDRERTVILTPGTGTQVQQAPGGSLRMEVMLGRYQGASFTINQQGATFGRMAGNTIVLEDATVSSRHARIVWQAGYYYLEDLGSRNGTYLNGQQISRAVIEHGSTFKIGSSEGTFSLT